MSLLLTLLLVFFLLHAQERQLYDYYDGVVDATDGFSWREKC